MKKINKEIPAVFLALKDKEVPLSAKIIAGITVGYALSPIDLIPDFIPVLGYLDDLVILLLLITLTFSLYLRTSLNDANTKQKVSGKTESQRNGIMPFR